MVRVAISCRDAARMSPMHKIEEMDRQSDATVICNIRLDVCGKKPVAFLLFCASRWNPIRLYSSVGKLGQMA
jgi:hypothetical protein